MMNLFSYLRCRVCPVPGLLMAAFCLLPALSSCGGGSGSSGEGGESQTQGAGNLLPDEDRFLPEYFSSAELRVEGSNLSMQLTCERDSPLGDCISGPLSMAADNKLNIRGEDGSLKSFSLSGNWEQRANNGFNYLRGLFVYRAEDYAEELLLRNVDICILQREDDPNQIDNTIILKGYVASGSLRLNKVESDGIIGAEVRIVYTIAPGYVNAETHGTAAAPADDGAY